MPKTVEEIKKQVSDANTAAAVAALEAQVNKARASYANMNKTVDMAAGEGAGRIAKCLVEDVNLGDKKVQVVLDKDQFVHHNGVVVE